MEIFNKKKENFYFSTMKYKLIIKRKANRQHKLFQLDQSDSTQLYFLLFSKALVLAKLTLSTHVDRVSKEVFFELTLLVK